MSGVLTLIPTPIDDQSPLCEKTKTCIINGIKSNAIILVEELKANRRRWITHGLPRDTIDNFVLYNEHTRDKAKFEILAELKSGKDVFLLSDCGLPAFCDPGQELVDLAHKNNIRVTSTPFSNSISLGIALSGFKHNKFMFEGFIPVKKEDRTRELKRILKSHVVSILMDTPYRLKRLLEEIEGIDNKRTIFLGLDLNQETEQLCRGNARYLLNKLENFKREFILILGDK